MKNIAYCILFLVFFVFLNFGFGAPFYVSTSGNDSNAGSFSAPFATLQHAVDVMSAGVTSATTYVFPGDYAQNVVIRSNKNNGYMVITALSNNKPPHYTGGLWAFAFVTNTPRVMFKNLYISNYTSVGIYLNSSRSNISLSNTIVHVAGGGWGGGIGVFNSSEHNRIIGNILHNNERSIKIDGSLTRFNMISNNNVSYDTSDAGIYLRAECRSNYIYNNFVSHESGWGGGIYFESAHQNVMKRNTIWSNNLGIYFDNDSKGNTIFSNEIFANSQAGIYLKNATNTLVQGNTLYAEQGWAGPIFLETQAYSNRIIGNIITNSIYGVYCKGSKNRISQNITYGISSTTIDFYGSAGSSAISNALSENYRGIQIENNCSSITLSRNGIYKSQYEGIYVVSGTAVSIINNTIISNYRAGAWGAQVNVGASGTVNIFKNNIVAFNDNNGYGVYGGGTISSLTYNDVFSNAVANYWNITPGTGTITNNPLLLSTDIHNSNFLALSSGSPCIDAGDPADPVPPNGGTRIDMGWKEFIASAPYTGPFYVDDDSGNDSNPGTFASPFATIQHVADVLSSGINVTSATAYVFPGLYNEEVTINSNNYSGLIVFTALSNTKPVMTGGGTLTYGVHIVYSTNVLIKDFAIKRYSYGINVTGVSSTVKCSNIIIESNAVYSNSLRNIYMSFSRKCSILGNSPIRRSTIGIHIDQYSSENLVQWNRVFDHDQNGIILDQSSHSNEVSYNLIASNSQRGLTVANGSKDELIYRNRFARIDQDAIYLSGAGTTRIYHNSLYSNANLAGNQITMVSGTALIHNNIIANSKRYGIGFAGGTVIVSYNDVYSNILGNYAGITPGNNSISNVALWDVSDINSTNFLTLYSISPCIDVGTNLGYSYIGIAPDMGWKESPFIKNLGPFYVDDDSGNDSNPGTFSSPFATIQHAVDVMMPGPPTCTVATTYVFPGNYNESIGVQSNNNAEFMVITSLTNTKQAVVYGSGLPTNTVGIKIDNTSSVMIKNLMVKLFTDSGIAIDNTATNNYIISNIICSNDTDHDGGNGISIFADGGDNNYLMGNKIYGTNQDNGIYIDQGDNNIIRENSIHHSSSNGIYIIGNATNIYMSHNNIYSNELYGIHINDNGADYNSIVSNRIWGWNQDAGIRLYSPDHTVISSNKLFYLALYGIYLRGSSSSNYISHNLIYSNKIYGIHLSSDSADHNYIYTNECFGLNQNYGIRISSGDYNIVRGNYSHKHQIGGCLFSNTGAFNYIVKNTLESNTTYGLYFDSEDADNNYILSNKIAGTNQDYGIYITDGDNNIIQSNQCYDLSADGIHIIGTATNNLIKNNKIYSNKSAGINIGADASDKNNIIHNIGEYNYFGMFLYAGDNNVILSNIFIRNQFGVNIVNTAQSNIFKHNFLGTNTSTGLRVNSDTADNNQIISNQIWGVGQDHGIDVIDGDETKIYRNLFVRNDTYNISVSGSAENTKIVNNTFYKTTASSGVYWANTSSGTLYNNIFLSNKTYGIDRQTSAIVYADYNCFYGNGSGATNNNVSIGSYNVFGNPLLDTITSYTITSIDSMAVDRGIPLVGISDLYNGVAPDMGWKESDFTKSRLSIVKSISNINDYSGNSKPIPGAKIIYKLFYTNFGIAQNQCIYDHLPTNITFWTGYYATGVTGWTLQYSTNSSPTNQFTSSDYTSTIPLDKTMIKWVRWKKSALNNDETGVIYYEVMIK